MRPRPACCTLQTVLQTQEPLTADCVNVCVNASMGAESSVTHAGTRHASVTSLSLHVWSSLAPRPPPIDLNRDATRDAPNVRQASNLCFLDNNKQTATRRPVQTLFASTATSSELSPPRVRVDPRSLSTAATFLQFL